jgi:excisionase family DNA binding protein
MDELLTINELSAFLKIPKSTIYSWCYQKKLPYIKMGGLLRFRKPAIERWLKEQGREEVRWK